MRCGRSERAGDLKAGNITPPLDWTTTSVSLTLPRAARGLGFAWDVFEFVDSFGRARKQEATLARGAGLSDRVKVDLHLLELDAEVGELAVELAVSVDLAGEPPIVMVNEGVMEQCEIVRGAHQEKTEPRR